MSDYKGAERWDRLVVTLAERAGVPDAEVSAKHYDDDSGGGTSRSIILFTTDGVIEIADTWWRKNPNIWTGWQVTVSGRDDIITRQYPKVKARGPVADQVREALATVAAAS